jgi:hypothetical protein
VALKTRALNNPSANSYAAFFIPVRFVHTSAQFSAQCVPTTSPLPRLMCGNPTVSD